MKTTLRTYNFDTRIASERIAYDALCQELRATVGRGHWMESNGRGSHWLNELTLDAIEITLETAHLFDNQWNTAPIGKYEKGLRVFDWAQDYKPDNSPYIKRGHYLTITPEMVEIRANTMCCGYCGKQEPAQKGYVFCPHCLDSAHLTESDLRLTRMRPCDAGLKYESPELSEAEKAHLMPLFVEAQIHGTTSRGKARILKERAGILKERDSTIHHAQVKFDGFTWLMDHGVNTENCIYYSHKGKFNFGWREPIKGAVRDSLLESLHGFPFEYDVE